MLKIKYWLERTKWSLKPILEILLFIRALIHILNVCSESIQTLRLSILGCEHASFIWSFRWTLSLRDFRSVHSIKLEKWSSFLDLSDLIIIHLSYTVLSLLHEVLINTWSLLTLIGVVNIFVYDVLYIEIFGCLVMFSHRLFISFTLRLIYRLYLLLIHLEI